MNQQNILWIMTDQHRYDALSCVGHISDLTPHLDQLAADGILFENCYTPSPVCGPARTALKSGRYPAACGAVRNWVDSHSPDWLPERLSNCGYDTGMAGKLHITPCERSYGFRWRALSDAPYSVYADDDKHSEYIAWLRSKRNGQDPVPLFDADESSYESDFYRFCAGSGFRTLDEHETGWTSDRFLEYLNERPAERPFFFFLSYFGPHHPYLAPAPYDTWLQPKDVRLPDSYYHDLMKDHPVYEAVCRTLREKVMTELTEQQVRELAAQYYGQVRMLDEDIGRVLNDLRNRGLYEKTMIIFTSDHGDHLGEYGLFFKSQMYDSCCRIPLIIKPAGQCTPRRCKQVVSSIDLYGTILDAAGDAAWQKPDVEARTLTPLLQGHSDTPGEAYSIFGPNRNRALTMLRRGDKKLIRLACGSVDKAVYEYYDLSQDTREVTDLYPTMQNSTELLDMKQALDAWYLKQYHLYPSA